MPALNPRSNAALDDDLSRIAAAVGDRPWCVNLVAHKSNERLAPDLDVVLRHKVPIVVPAPGPRTRRRNPRKLARSQPLPQYGRTARAEENRSEERRGGKECVSTWISRWSPHH